jgi:hypothetical protein
MRYRIEDRPDMDIVAKLDKQFKQYSGVTGQTGATVWLTDRTFKGDRYSIV